ncbi:MAG: NADH-quinone oxidoreductase subunit NuoK [Planctomycetes bacterium]|nr:NADH-quinone oxidoreductase subunit NuoK [Planctomycetota bacterium]
MNPQLENSLLIGGVLLVFGIVGFLTRRNLIVMFLSVELMLQAVALNLIGFGHAHCNYHGQSFTIFILTVAACEAAIALMLFLAIYHRRKTLDVSIWYELGEVDVHLAEPQIDKEAMLSEPEPVQQFPGLTPAGLEPVLDGQITSEREGVVTRA